MPRTQTTAPEGESQEAHEFYFLQWSHYNAPPVPSPNDLDIFTPPKMTQTDTKNSPISTVLFTPLAEYKLRQSFATPHLVLTFYTDLESTHGTVLMRGDITPSTTPGGDGRYLLSQLDAQLLTVALQKYYLWSDSKGSMQGAALLKLFHEKPEEFKWEDLLTPVI